MNKEKKKSFQRNIGFIFIKTCIAINSSIPLNLNYFLGSILGNIAYIVVARHRKIALESLKVAFPEKTLAQRKRITRDFFVNMVQGSFELLHCLRNLDDLRGVSIEGQKHLKEALTGGRGVILVTAHMGNFPMMSLKLANKGYPVSFVTRPMRDARAGEYIHELRTNAGVKTIYSYPRRECVNSIISALRNNEIVILQMDQNFGTGGVWVKFFGKLAATPVGPVTLGLRTKAAIVPAYIFKTGKAKHMIKILPQEELVIKEDKDESVLVNVIKLTRIIEGWVREHAYQWSWIHRRWKSRPSQKIKDAKYKIEH